METKFKEIIIGTTKFPLMRDKYLSERLVRKYSEDFVDEDTGQVVSLDRNELIYEKGTKVTDSEMTVINFHLQTGDLKEVFVSNQQRFGSVGTRQSAVWQVTANYGSKKYNLFLYSNSILKTYEIANDYLEQLVGGIYSITTVKELDYSTLIPEGYFKEEVTDEVEVGWETNYYKMEVSIVDENWERRENFIVNATDAEKGKEIILKFLLFKRAQESEEAEEYHIDETVVTIISAKTIPCDYVIDYEFSLEYLQDENET